MIWYDIHIERTLSTLVKGNSDFCFLKDTDTVQTNEEVERDMDINAL